MTDEQKQQLLELWEAYLEKHYGHLDFWRLNKRYKQTVYQETARFIVQDIVDFAEIHKHATRDQN